MDQHCKRFTKRDVGKDDVGALSYEEWKDGHYSLYKWLNTHNDECVTSEFPATTVKSNLQWK